jgi:transketolase C-terminal domain/subunit
MRRNEFIALAAGLAMSGCAHAAASSARFYDIEKGGEPFRAAFNRDSDSVRIVALVSPT